MTIMKKTYNTPTVKVVDFDSEVMLMTISGDKADGNTHALSRERGTRQKSETIFEEELW